MSASLTKKAYARGIGEALQRQGHIQFPSIEFLKEAADKAASLIELEPAEEAIYDGECLKVAQYLSQVNDQLKQSGKTASWPQSVTLAVDSKTAFGDLIQKVAAEATGQSSAPTAVGMGDHGNTMEAAAGESDLAQKEHSERPKGYANVGQGNTNIGEGGAANIGTEQDHPKKPKPVGGASTNSVIQASKSASFAEILQKMAEGQPGGDTPTAVGMADHSNDLPAAAGESDMAAQELGNRPEGYAVVGQGNANVGESAGANIGEEQPHPGQPSDAPGSNSVTQASQGGGAKVAQARAAGQQSVTSLLQSLSQSFG